MGVTLSLSLSQGSQSVTNNTTSVTLKASVVSTYGSYNHNVGQTTGSYTIKNADTGATLKSGTFAHTFDADTTTKILDISAVCSHNTDGTLKLKCSVTYNTGVRAGTITGSISKTITTIPRASKINTITTEATLGKNINITMTRYSNSFWHKAFLESVPATGGRTRSYESDPFQSSLTLTSNQIGLNWAQAAPSGRSFKVDVTVKTYTNQQAATEVGEASTQINVSIPNDDNFAPTAAAPNTQLDKDYQGYALQGISRIKILNADITEQYPKWGADIAYATINGNRIPVQQVPKPAPSTAKVITYEYTSGILKGQKNTFNVVEVDTRGYETQTRVVDITAYPYSGPTITNISIFRCNAGGTADDNGHYASITATAQIAPVTVGGVDKNEINKFVYTLKQVGGSGTEVALTSGETQIVLLPGTSPEIHSYEVALYLKDNVGKDTTVKKTISSAAVAFNLREGGRGAAFGKYAETDECLEVDYDVDIKGKLKSKDLSNKFDKNAAIISQSSANIEHFECIGVTRISDTPITMVLVRMRLTVKTSISADTYVVIGNFTENYPRITQPLVSEVMDADSHCSASIHSDGSLRFKSTKAVDVGKYIYINGFWFV